MSTFKKTKVVMLPTGEKAIIGFLTQKGKERGHLVHFDRPMPNILDSENQHLYFLSDEEIKEGDWFLMNGCIIRQCKSTNKEPYTIHTVVDTTGGIHHVSVCEKIIATTELLTSNINLPIGSFNYLPQPSQSFIEKFVEEYNKGNVITEVMVEYFQDVPVISDEEYEAVEKGEMSYKDTKAYNIDVLKVNPKDNTITIRKVKDSWNRDEVIEFAKRYARRCQAPMTDNKWFEENL